MQDCPFIFLPVLGAFFFVSYMPENYYLLLYSRSNNWFLIKDAKSAFVSGTKSYLNGEPSDFVPIAGGTEGWCRQICDILIESKRIKSTEFIEPRVDWRKNIAK